ncbi:MAG: Hsp20/alpha crystallin family protein [Cyanobacteriota bacterium]|nr:Hsp20/alpha crystallin family protein [Cyanobacteriota bacterium]
MTIATNHRKAWCPAIEVKETATHLILKAEMPGLTANDLEIQVSPETVSIRGEHPEAKNEGAKELFPSELHYGPLECNFPLPVRVNRDRVNAELVDGVLTLLLPKVEASSS